MRRAIDRRATDPDDGLRPAVLGQQNVAHAQMLDRDRPQIGREACSSRETLDAGETDCRQVARRRHREVATVVSTGELQRARGVATVEQRQHATSERAAVGDHALQHDQIAGREACDGRARDARRVQQQRAAVERDGGAANNAGSQIDRLTGDVQPAIAGNQSRDHQRTTGGGYRAIVCHLA